jgi:hypothetical protein
VVCVLITTIFEFFLEGKPMLSEIKEGNALFLNRRLVGHHCSFKERFISIISRAFEN